MSYSAVSKDSQESKDIFIFYCIFNDIFRLYKKDKFTINAEILRYIIFIFSLFFMPFKMHI